MVLHSDSVMVTTLACVASELEHKELVILGTEPWMQMNYGLVVLKARLPLSDDLAVFKDYLHDAERVIAELERSLVVRWATIP